MKKILLCTIVDYNNYGNRLQNYSMQEILKKLGYEVETLRNKHFPSSRKRKLILLLKNKSFSYFFGLLKNKIFSKDQKSGKDILFSKRQENIKCFTKKYIKETDYSIYSDQGNLIPVDDYDFFVVGSDQVWNPEHRYGSQIDFLRFAPAEKRVAYSPSIGLDQLPLKYEGKYKKWISEIPMVSIREDAGAKIVKELTNRKVPVLLDPTMLLGKEEWKTIFKPSSGKPSGNYLATYFLEGLNKTQLEFVNRVSRKNDLEIVHLLNYDYPEHYTVDPGSFIDYINSSELLLTDSFHGVVFSIIFNKPFVVFRRGNMNSRIDTILNRFSLLNRQADLLDFKDLFNINFTDVQAVLKIEQDRSIAFLKDALN